MSQPTIKQGELTQTDRASAFVVDRVKCFLTPSLITMQNIVAAYHTMSAQVWEVPKIWGCLSPAHRDGDVADPLEIILLPTMPISIIPGQTVRA